MKYIDNTFQLHLCPLYIHIKIFIPFSDILRAGPERFAQREMWKQEVTFAGIQVSIFWCMNYNIPCPHPQFYILRELPL